MTTVVIIPIEAERGTSYQAMSGDRRALGETPGGALDALEGRFPELSAESLLVVQRFRADRFFTADQQKRLEDLMARWRAARDQRRRLPPGEQAELEALVDEELRASARRAEQAAQSLQ